MEEEKKLALPEGKLTLRRELEGPAGRLGLLLLLPAALLLLLAAAGICREAGTIRPVYTTAALAGIFCLALLARLLAPKGGRLWLELLFVGAAALRVVFALKWTVWPHEEYLAGWNLALELSRAGAGQWRELVRSAGEAGAAAPAVYQSILIRLFGPTLAAVQIPNGVWGGVSCLLTALIGEKLSGSRLTGLIAGGLLAFCPTLLFSAGVLTVLPLYTALLLAGVWLLLCRPFARTLLNHGLAGAAWGLCQVLCPGLPIPLGAAVLWLLLTLPGRKRDRTLGVRAVTLAAAFLIVWLAAGGLLWALTGAGPMAGAALGGTGSLRQLAGKIRTQFASYDYSWARLDRGIPIRDKIIDSVMHPLLQSYALGLLLLALWGVLRGVKRADRNILLLPALLLAALAAAALAAEADPIGGSWVIPLLALLGAAPARQLADWTVLMAAPETGRGRRKTAPPLPLPLRIVKLVVSVAVYVLMLAMVLIFFTGNGAFIYEAF
ncbi:hypothetical protein [Intestinimonas massiliensis (ex Afouda et al. 2020)]|uniref:hypothetical protein n=1 Tax=Intestinimonas massiliensis (ex Afouda et al. 2020) TaxID=1673721 RepID=UPI0010326CFC|nr:hypothetical protein [Intestinimonas massiliensis (ex Afouda et al. 2020)]